MEYEGVTEAMQEQATALSQKTGWQIKDWDEIHHNLPLSDKERSDMGIELSHSMLKIKSLKDELKRVGDSIKGEIKQIESHMTGVAQDMNRGERRVATIMPGFLDFDAKEVVYIDVDSGEEIKRVQMSESDFQMELHSQEDESDEDQPEEEDQEEAEDDEDDTPDDEDEEEEEEDDDEDDS